MHKHASFLVALALLLPLCLCSCATTLKPSPDPDAIRFLAFFEQHRKELKSFRGIGKLKIMVHGKRQTARMVWIGSQPANLRVETLGVWGQPTFTFLVHGSKFSFYDHYNNRFFRGKPTPRNLSRVIFIPMRAEDLFSFLSGQPPVVPFHDAKIRALEGEGQWLLCLYKKRARLIEKMWLEDDGKTVARVEVFDGWGHLQYTTEYSTFEKIEGFWIPHEMVISHPQGMSLSMKVDRFWTKVPIPVDAYRLDTGVVGLDP